MRTPPHLGASWSVIRHTEVFASPSSPYNGEENVHAEPGRLHTAPKNFVIIKSLYGPLEPVTAATTGIENMLIKIC